MRAVDNKFGSYRRCDRGSWFQGRRASTSDSYHCNSQVNDCRACSHYLQAQNYVHTATIVPRGSFPKDNLMLNLAPSPWFCRKLGSPICSYRLCSAGPDRFDPNVTYSYFCRGCFRLAAAATRRACLLYYKVVSCSTIHSCLAEKFASFQLSLPGCLVPSCLIWSSNASARLMAFGAPHADCQRKCEGLLRTPVLEIDRAILRFSLVALGRQSWRSSSPVAFYLVAGRRARAEIAKRTPP